MNHGKCGVKVATVHGGRRCDDKNGYMYKQPDQPMTIRFASFRIMLEQHLLRNFRSFCGNDKKVSTRAHCARITLPNFLLSECLKQMVPLASGDACHLSPHFKENMQ
jgi:hypothetical protein